MIFQDGRISSQYNIKSNLNYLGFSRSFHKNISRLLFYLMLSIGKVIYIYMIKTRIYQNNNHINDQNHESIKTTRRKHGKRLLHLRKNMTFHVVKAQNKQIKRVLKIVHLSTAQNHEGMRTINQLTKRSMLIKSAT